MSKARKLVDLYKSGVEVIFEEGTQDEVVVWVQKLIPPETQQALKRANTERSKVLTIKHLPAGSESREEFRSDLERVYTTREDRVSLIASEAIAQAFESAQAEEAGREEWTKDDYLTGLQESWDDDVQGKIDAGEEVEPESQRIYDEIQRFNARVAENYKKRETKIFRDYKAKSQADLDEEALTALIEAEATSAWLQEFRKSQVWLATREMTNHRELYFENRSEIDELATQVLTRLLTTYTALEVSPSDAKS